jgi:pilus assembly protein Flp/PilA
MIWQRAQRKIHCTDAAEASSWLTLEGAMRQLTKLLRNSRGASAIEYALVASLISIAGILAMTNVGNKINVMYNNVSNHLD